MFAANRWIQWNLLSIGLPGTIGDILRSECGPFWIRKRVINACSLPKRVTPPGAARPQASSMLTATTSLCETGSSIIRSRQSSLSLLLRLESTESRGRCCHSDRWSGDDLRARRRLHARSGARSQALLLEVALVRCQHALDLETRFQKCVRSLLHLPSSWTNEGQQEERIPSLCVLTDQSGHVPLSS